MATLKLVVETQEAKVKALHAQLQQNKADVLTARKAVDKAGRMKKKKAKEYRDVTETAFSATKTELDAAKIELAGATEAVEKEAAKAPEPEATQEAVAAFASMDADGDGQISKEEFEKANPGAEWRADLDKDDDGQISKKEFVAAAVAQEEEPAADDPFSSGAGGADPFGAGAGAGNRFGAAPAGDGFGAAPSGGADPLGSTQPAAAANVDPFTGETSAFHSPDGSMHEDNHHEHVVAEADAFSSAFSNQAPTSPGSAQPFGGRDIAGFGGGSDHGQMGAASLLTAIRKLMEEVEPHLIAKEREQDMQRQIIAKKNAEFHALVAKKAAIEQDIEVTQAHAIELDMDSVVHQLDEVEEDLAHLNSEQEEHHLDADANKERYTEFTKQIAAKQAEKAQLIRENSSAKADGKRQVAFIEQLERQALQLETQSVTIQASLEKIQSALVDIETKRDAAMDARAAQQEQLEELKTKMDYTKMQYRRAQKDLKEKQEEFRSKKKEYKESQREHKNFEKMVVDVKSEARSLGNGDVPLTASTPGRARLHSTATSIATPDGPAPGSALDDSAPSPNPFAGAGGAEMDAGGAEDDAHNPFASVPADAAPAEGNPFGAAAGEESSVFSAPAEDSSPFAAEAESNPFGGGAAEDTSPFASAGAAEDASPFGGAGAAAADDANPFGGGTADSSLFSSSAPSDAPAADTSPFGSAPAADTSPFDAPAASADPFSGAAPAAAADESPFGSAAADDSPFSAAPAADAFGAPAADTSSPFDAPAAAGGDPFGAAPAASASADPFASAPAPAGGESSDPFASGGGDGGADPFGAPAGSASSDPFAGSGSADPFG